MTRSVATSLGAAVKLGQFILEIISPSETEYFSELYAWNRRAPKIRFFGISGGMLKIHNYNVPLTAENCL